MKAKFSRIVGDGPAYPLFILFGLNAVDELDRTAFAILTPEIRDEFGQVRFRIAPGGTGKQENKVPRLVRPRPVAGGSHHTSFCG